MTYYLRQILRLIFYKNERRKFRKERHITRSQDQLLSAQNIVTTKKLVIFLVDGADWHTGVDKISGGILSIASIYNETDKLKDEIGADVIMVTLPESYLLLKHSQFPNDITVYRFEQLRSFTNLSNVIIHIPEFKFKLPLVIEIGKTFNFLDPKNIHLNILNQRLDLMPGPNVIAESIKMGFFITQTTAHENYSTLEIRNKFGIPLHKFSVFSTPKRYPRKDYKQKKNIILISPDKGKLKGEIMQMLKSKFPDYIIEIIENLKYTDYLKKVQDAKFMITFGEGLDFYFIETVFSGGIAFAVYNDVFFTEDFQNLEGVFKSYEEMNKNLSKELLTFDNNQEYKDVNNRQFNICQQLYSDEIYHLNIYNFYKNKYLFP